MEMDDRIKKLLAVAASVGANCHPCLEYHVGRALESGIDKSDILEAVNVAKTVRGGATASMDKLALKILSDETPQKSYECRESSCSCS
jgi:AhpD family alkylhydroperoxidase